MLRMYLETPIVHAVMVVALVMTGFGSSVALAAESGNAAGCTPLHKGLHTITKGVLTVAQYEYPPFSMYDASTNALTGIEGEIITKFAKLECLKMKVIQGSAAAMITSVATGRADITLGSWYRTKKRAKVVNLSAPVIVSPFAAVSKKGLNTVDELKKVQVGAGQGLVGIDDLKKAFGGNLHLYPNDNAAFHDLKVGRIDADVLGFIAGVRQIKVHDLKGYVVKAIKPDERIPVTLNPGESNFPVNKNNEKLGNAIDDVIHKLRKDGTLDKLAKKYGLSPVVVHPKKPTLL